MILSLSLSALTLATALGVHFATRRTVRRRTDDLRRTADAICAGDLSLRVPVGQAGSIFDQQAQAVNRMLDSINDRMEAVHNANNGVAHELRTPLARLRNQLSLIARDPQAQAVRDRIEAAQAQADQMLDLFSALLRIAEVDSGSRRTHFQAVDLSALLADCVETLEPMIEESGHRLVPGPSSSDPVIVSGDVQLLTQMIVNLVENAVRHTPADTQIRLGLSNDGQPSMARLTVADNGPGIAAADRGRALERFGRLPRDGGQAKGYGFGLPLAASIARMHGGELELGDARPGLQVTVHLRRT